MAKLAAEQADLAGVDGLVLGAPEQGPELRLHQAMRLQHRGVEVPFVEGRQLLEQALAYYAALLLFAQVSLAGPLANALAIPLVSVVITPLTLLAAALPFDFLLEAAAWLVEWLLAFLEWCAALPGAVWEQHTPPVWAVGLALAGAAWILAPRGVPWRAGGIALMAPAFLLAPPVPAPGQAWITALDVGQGLAVLVRTASRTLLYDAGPAYGPEADSGGRIVVPLLRATGVCSVDLLVLTP